MAERQVWKRRVGQWKRSGLTAAEFARKSGGFNANTLKFWKWQFGKEKRSTKVVPTATAVEFLELEQPSPPSLPVSESVFVLELGGGPYRIRVAPAFDAEGLRRLLSVLEGE